MGIRAARPAQRRSATGPFIFVLLIVGLLVGGFVFGRPIAEDAIVAQVQEHDTLLKQSIIRGLIADRVGSEPDQAKDPHAESRTFVISRGETAGSIGQRLQEAGFIRSALAFSYLLYDTGRETSLQSGTYTISAALTPRELARVFEKAPSEQTVLRIIEGWRLSETAAAVNKVFPSISYFFKPSATATQIVDALLDQFELRVGQTLRQAAVDRKTTIYDIVKLGSIVEREARDRKESPTIAGVYTNRLDIGMKLDADPTVQYALGDWKELSLPDLEVDSPYNTYRVAGLPPTPICSPGAAALEGAAKPEQNPFFYFVAKNDGTGDHAFAKTLEEHEANRIKYGNK